ncbi:hypothetical protein ESY86_20400 [Subsaximicrobium wynnwilliamsii]|uniref:DUF4595 domain-containing protein n=1 Tax=Subsaximicrobium wynnwilliamsii TaxID=291179 RepID=A0A5C6ZBQ4_9FLAO|nr:hypothetical protein [Subsaximicrobium wynnwilliamsii]TXD80606.1 hypothetical protein ESY87_20545 [Subsaximicrobium wynnwilliamsii]TXD86314.1 hypothetical protein ESY86_20400 [Subsaximicrobium wynnwilliamsii]TXD99699.1 hypothetical protein ESY88_20490 [Subsaximicrobium wynnwilliamsii]
MNRLLILLFSISLIGCCNEPKLLNNGLTQKTTQITEYTIEVKNDSLNNKIQDTLVITEKKYNENDQIISRHQRNLFADETMDIEFIYNNDKNVKREIVTLSNDSSNFIVDYLYKDTLLIETKSESKNDIFQFKQIGGYKYNSDNELKESSIKQIYIDVETNDTITNTLEISKYNNKEFVTESKLSDFTKPERNRNTEYKYDCGILMEMKEFNSKDSLTSKTEYKYVFDKFENWIKRESIENDNLNYIRTRKIEYK